MAFNLLTLRCSDTPFAPKIVPLKPLVTLSSSCKAPRHVHCSASNQQACNPMVERRSANYQPSIWDFDFIQSLKTDYTEDMYERQAKKLEDVRGMINAEDMGVLARLELIDDMGRLGVGYLFDKEIKRALDAIAAENINVGADLGSLHTVALRFEP